MIYGIEDMVRGDCLFAATGVTTRSLLGVIAMVAIASGMFLAHRMCPQADRRRYRVASRHRFDLLPDIQHRRFIALALADHSGAFDRQLVELAAHRVDRGLVGASSLLWPRRRHRRALGHPHDLKCKNAL
jgi:hypothetical protein